MTRKLYLIAGEASGDAIGGGLMQALQAAEPSLHFNGIGGPHMQAQGLQSLFDMQQLSLMGFAEVLPHIPRLKKRIRETVADILAKRPDVLITIDSPGFTFRVVKKLRKAGFSAPCIHYVAPTVWAYKPKRAAKTAKLFDALLCILPFEPPYFEAHGLPTHFVGHPIGWQHRTPGDGAAFRASRSIAPDSLVLGMMPGSRMGELKRHLPLFRATAGALKDAYPNLQIVIPTNNNMLDPLKAQTKGWPVPVTFETDSERKRDALAACNLALAKSGTVALEVALAGVPLVTTFRANPISVALVRQMIRIPYVNLINILALFKGNPAPIPELLQQDAKPKALTAALRELIDSPDVQTRQREACAHYAEQLGLQEDTSPSEKAANAILKMP